MRKYLYQIYYHTSRGRYFIKMNMAQMAKDGRSTRKYKFSKRQYRRLVRLREQGWTLQRLGEKFGVSFSVVYRVLRSNYFGE